jgi:general nucleoside transport system permease protein
MTDLLLSTLRLSTPLIFAALAGLICERSGVINIALESFLLVGAFAAASICYFSSSATIGWSGAFLITALFASLYAFTVLKLKMDQIVAGTAMNLLALGAIPFASKIIFDSTGSTPSLAIDLRLSYEPLLFACFVFCMLVYTLNHSRLGLAVLFAGEKPESLESAGISVFTLRWWCIILSGGLAGLGGAALSLSLASSYSPQMSAGRGFIALAAMIAGRWRPGLTVIACLFFGLIDALQIRLQGINFAGVKVPVQFIQILPYVLTLVLLSLFVKQNKPPAALGK